MSNVLRLSLVKWLFTSERKAYKGFTSFSSLESCLGLALRWSYRQPHHQSQRSHSLIQVWEGYLFQLVVLNLILMHQDHFTCYLLHQLSSPNLVSFLLLADQQLINPRISHSCQLPFQTCFLLPDQTQQVKVHWLQAITSSRVTSLPKDFDLQVLEVWQAF